MRGGRVHTGINDLSGKIYRQDKRVNAWHDGV